MTPERFRRLRGILDRRQPDLTVLMDRLEKPHNFSAVLRSCDAVGVLRAHIVTSDVFQPRRTAAGGVGRYVRVSRHPTMAAVAARLKADGFALIAAHPSAEAIDFRALDYTRPTALLLGAEREGLSAEARAAADQMVAVPMLGAVTSLNVSVAAAVILFEAQRQRTAAGLYDESRLDDDLARDTLFEWAYPRVAALCRRRRVAYPRLGAEGELLDEPPR
jgi:tRNA (guanosine-2'-O-)-methyltransferase